MCRGKYTARVRLLAAGMLATSLGCVAPPAPSSTLWQRLGLPPASRLLGVPANRNGKSGIYRNNVAGTEPGKPVIIASEKAKSNDLAAGNASYDASPEQRIKTLQSLAANNGTCLNQDATVEQTLLDALDDNDTAVKLAAIEAIENKAMHDCPCGKCNEINDFNQELLAKLRELAYGADGGSFQEPSEAVRAAAARVVNSCRSSRRSELKEIPSLPAQESEEPTASVEASSDEDQTLVQVKPEEASQEQSLAEPNEEVSSRRKKPNKAHFRAFEVAYKLSDSSAEDSDLLVIINKGLAAEPDGKKEAPQSNQSVRSETGSEKTAPGSASPDDNPNQVAEPDQAVASTDAASDQEQIARAQPDGKPEVAAPPAAPQPIDGYHVVSNPDALVAARVVSYRHTLGQVLVDLPDAFDLQRGWHMVVVDGAGKYSLGQIADYSDRRLLLSLENLAEIKLGQGEPIKIGLVSKQ